jgi:hypothetical protein
MPHLPFHSGLSGLVMVALAVVALVLVAVFYRRAYGALRRGQWQRLYWLRSAAIVIVLLLLFRPVLSFQRTVTERRTLVFLIDTSASMGITDAADGTPRLLRAVSHLQDWIGRLQDQFKIRLIAFSDTTRPLRRSVQLADLQADGTATSLSQALVAARRAAPRQDIEAALLITDGIHNCAGSPAKMARQLGFPVDTIGVGSTAADRTAYRDIRVTGLECPAELYVDNRARLKASIDATGFPGRVIRPILRDGDQQIDQRELVLDDAEGPQEVTFEWVPTVKGVHTYTVEIPPAPEEKISQNNRRSTSAQVVDARIRVLYVEGTLRAEYGALVGRFLAKDPALEFCALVQTRPNVFVQRSNIEGLALTTIPDEPELLATFDVLLIGDLDASYLKPALLELICQRVRDGAGLLMMGGYHSLGPGGYAATPLADILPVFVGDRHSGQVTGEFVPELTAEGRRHPIFANIAEFFPSENQPAAVAGLPPLQGCVRVLGAKPGGTVLAIHPTALVGSRPVAAGQGSTPSPEQALSGAPMPVMVVQPVGKGRAAVLTGDTTRNWHQMLRTLNRESPFLRFWGQTVRWLAGRSDQVATEAGIVATTDKAYYEPESAVEITAVVRGQEGAAAEQAQVTAAIDAPSGPPSTLVLQRASGPAGHYRGQFTPPSAGQYKIVVKANLGETQLQAKPLTVAVGRPYLEFDRLALDDKTLLTIAHESGGRYTHISSADRLIDRLRRREQQRQIDYELPLSSPPLLWVMFVTALTSEWLLRRKYQLR